MERANSHRSDFFWYVVIGLLVVFAIGAYVVYVPEGARPSRKWAEFALYTCFMFIFLAKFYWRIRRRLKLWLIMLAASVVHVSVFVPLLYRIENWASVAYLLLLPVEIMIIAIVVKLALGVMPDPNVRL